MEDFIIRGIFNNKDKSEDLVKKGYGQVYFEVRTPEDGYFIDAGALYYNLNKYSLEDAFKWLCQQYPQGEVDYY